MRHTGAAARSRPEGWGHGTRRRTGILALRPAGGDGARRAHAGLPACRGRIFPGDRGEPGVRGLPAEGLPVRARGGPAAPAGPPATNRSRRLDVHRRRSRLRRSALRRALPDRARGAALVLPCRDHRSAGLARHAVLAREDEMTVETADLRPGHRISRVIKGGWQLAGDHGEVRPEQAIADMEAFLDAGITTFDCADIYKGVEEMIGAFIADVRRRRGAEVAGRVVVHTKLVPDLGRLDDIRPDEIEAIVDR